MNNPYFTNIKRRETNLGGQQSPQQAAAQAYPVAKAQGGTMQMPQQQSQGGQQGQSWASKQDVAGGVSSGLAAGAAAGTPEDEFSVDPNAGFKGSGQGLMSGGVIGAIVGGVTAQMGQFSKVNKAVEGLQKGVDGTTYDEYGRPVYNGANVGKAQADVAALQKGEKSVDKGIDPATRVFGALYGTKKKLRKAREKLQSGVKKAQDGFNKSESSFRDQEQQRSDYLQRMNNDRNYNLYKSQY